MVKTIEPPQIHYTAKELNRILRAEIEENKTLYRGIIQQLWKLRHYDQYTKEALQNNIKFFREYLQGSGAYLGKTQAQIRFLKFVNGEKV